MAPAWRRKSSADMAPIQSRARSPMSETKGRSRGWRRARSSASARSTSWSPRARARARRARHPRQYAGARLHAERHGDARKSRSCCDRARARRPVALAQGRRASAGSARGADFSRFRGKRLRHRPDHRGRRRQCKHVTSRPFRRQIVSLYTNFREDLIRPKESAMASATATKRAESRRPGPKHNIEVMREEYYERIAKHDMTPLWKVMSSVVTKEPVTHCVPVIWHYDDIKRLVMESGGLITAEEAERRVLILESPALKGQSKATNTLFAGVQMILPGEVAPAHRHVSSAIRFVLDGDGAY